MFLLFYCLENENELAKFEFFLIFYYALFPQGVENSYKLVNLKIVENVENFKIC